ncbi:MAG TPA: shikimate dehydrogenase [Allosphingosinicella sp.]|nr:shikimate dehydrogenase [Allosphingosinicella sp.]
MGIPYAEVIGDPVAHSKSPPIHKFWLGKLGMEGDYRRCRVQPGALRSYLAERWLDPDWRGCNVTMPFKAEIAPLLDAVDPAARRIGAVNTVVRQEVRLAGMNTDWIGLHLALGDHGAGGRDVVLIGAGGAARAALEELRQEAPRSLVVMNRDPAKAAGLLADFGIDGEAMPLGTPPPADLLINASALGMEDHPALDLDLGNLRADAAVLDMVYHPLDTLLLARARARGLIAIDGLRMLVGQAAMAFQYFFKAPPPKPYDDPELRELLTR